MMRKLHFILVLLILSNTANLLGQTFNRTTIKGVVCDSAGIVVPSAMVLLLATKDSAFIDYTQADDKGAFEFRNVKNSGYILKIQHMSFIPYQKMLPVSTTGLMDLGRIRLKIISKILMEVVIKAARAPLTFRGDTIEYDASSFKVPPGSTVEDLLRRLPGIDVDVAGNIRSEGKEVKRLYVEGKTFFGTDPKFATKNLGAEIVSKVQFFDEKSDMETLTGLKEPVHDTKAMNLSLKEEFKHGAFGKLTAAVGDQDRKALQGNYNRFDKKQMFSVIGFGNNVNQMGINWDDYNEFTGQSISGNINTDIDAGSRFMDLSIGNPLRDSYGGSGLTDNYGGGVNYNLDDKKTKISSSYSYNETTLSLFQTSNKETFLQTGSFKNADTTHNKEFRAKHNIEFCIEQSIDTANTFTSKSNIIFSTSKANNSTTSLFSDINNIQNQRLNYKNDNNLDSWRVNTGAIFRHKFRKEGRVFLWTGSFISDKSNGLDNPFSLNRFFEANTFTDQVRELNTNSNNTTTQFKSNLIFVEPLSKKVMLDVVYNLTATNTIQDKLTQNSAMQNIRVDSLTLFNTNYFLYNRIGFNFTYNFKNLYVRARVAGQQIQIKGDYSLRKDLPDLNDPINRIYSDLLPDLDFRYLLSKTTSFNVGYSDQIITPSMEQLMPIVNIDNPSYLLEGNPDLQPSRVHHYNLSLQSRGRKSRYNLYWTLDYGETKNAISMGRTYNTIENVGMQTVIKPENMKGIKKQTSLMVRYNLPLIKSKLSMSINSNLEFGTSPTLINGNETLEKNTSTSLETNFDLTLSQKLSIGLSGKMSANDMMYSQGNEFNQKVRSYSSNSSLSWQIATKSYFESNFNYSVYRNASLGFNRDIPLLNASFRQIVGKTNRIELRLSAFDIFNKNQSIFQSASELYIISTASNTLARYFMLSFSYNIKGYEIKSE